MTEKDTAFYPDPRSFLKNLSTQDFLNFGLQDIAYVRPSATETGKQYVVYAADGTALSVMDNLDSALAIIEHNDLESVTVH